MRFSLPFRLFAWTSTLLAIALAITGCNADGVMFADGVVVVNGAPSQTLSVALGQELHITLYTVGPGLYASPPAVSTSVLRFLDVSYVTEPGRPPGPGARTQRFRFTAETPGQAVVRFVRTPQNIVIEDTVLVR